MMIMIFLIGKDFKPHKRKKNNKCCTLHNVSWENMTLLKNTVRTKYLLSSMFKNDFKIRVFMF